MQKIAVVTGGAGFSGSHLTDRLLEDDWKVRVIDDFSIGLRANLGYHKNNTNLKIYECDIRDSSKVNQILNGADAVFHWAAHALMRVSVTDRKVDADINLYPTLNILNAMVSNGVNDLLFASSSAIYGEATITPTPEDYVGIQTSLYGAAKLGSEAYCAAYTQITPIRFWTFRPGTMLGERCRRGVIWDFAHKLKANPNQLEILGNGRQSKDYIYVKDCIDAIMLAYQKSSDRVNIFNLGMQQQTTVDELSDIVIEKMHLKGVKKLYTGQVHGWIGDNPTVYLSTEKIRRLGWKPTMSAKDAIRLTTEWTLKEIGES